MKVDVVPGCGMLWEVRGRALGNGMEESCIDVT